VAERGGAGAAGPGLPRRLLTAPDQPGSGDIRELARRCGVSVSTVSRALNDRRDVSAATRQRVLAMAAELGYRPNQQARALVRRRSDLVGVIWDTGYLATRGRHPFLQDLLVGLKLAFASTGWHLLLLSTADPGVDTHVRAARQHNVDGLILMGVDERDPAITALLASRVPCVAVDLPLHGRHAGYVTSDNRAGAAAAVAHLHALGHRRIATISGPRESLPGMERLAGYLYQAAKLDLAVPTGYVETGDFFLDGGRAAMQRLLALADPPTAVFAAGDQMAIGALDAVHEAGLDVPGQLSVVGYDDIEAAALVRPALTTVAQDSRRLADAAARLLSGLIAEARTDGDDEDQGTGGSPGHVRLAPGPRLVPNRLVVRASTGPPPPAGPPLPAPAHPGPPPPGH
jgi:LacI family transcriptional regulator